MKTKLLLFILFCSVYVVRAQQQQLPEGWDEIILNNQTAYMNMYTGETTYTKPLKPAPKPTIVKEVDPSIIHQVAKGETLYTIAKKYGITVDDIYKLNAMLDPKNIVIGQELVVGYDSSKEGKVEYEVVEDLYVYPSNNSVHYVRKGETLYSIARYHGLTVSKLKQINGLTSNTIEVGQKLLLNNP